MTAENNVFDLKPTPQPIEPCAEFPAGGALWMGGADDFTFGPDPHVLPTVLFTHLPVTNAVAVAVPDGTPDGVLPGLIYPTAEAARNALVSAIPHSVRYAVNAGECAVALGCITDLVAFVGSCMKLSAELAPPCPVGELRVVFAKKGGFTERVLLPALADEGLLAPPEPPTMPAPSE